MRAGNAAAFTNAGTRPRTAASSPVCFITASREASCNKAHVPPDTGTVSGGATRCSVWRGCGVSNHGYDSKHQGPGRRKSGPVHGAVLSREAKCGHANVQRDTGTVSRCDSWGSILPQESGRGVLGEKHDSNRFESCMCAAGFGYKIAVVFAAWGTKICSRELGQYSRQRPNVFRYNAAAIDYKMRYQLAWRNIAAQYGNIFDTI